MSIDIKDSWAYIAHDSFQVELIRELKDVTHRYGRLIFAAKDQTPVWAQDIWKDPKIIPIESVGKASQVLKSISGIKWKWLRTVSHGRAKLILSKVDTWPDVYRIPSFDFCLNKTIGGFALLDQDEMVISTDVNQQSPLGIYEFEEDKSGPPNRAYLKLWETFYRTKKWPNQNDVCLELGSSPGGWTWVLAPLCKTVISIDKADLDSKIHILPNVDHRLESAFALDPIKFPEVTWLFSDVICYPDRMLSLVKQWNEQSNVQNFVITIKLQGDTDFSVIHEFQEIAGSEVFHLYHNKHEVTFVCFKS